MIRYRIKVVLLVLGVVLGFGSAIARHQHFRHGGYAHHDHGACWDDWASWGESEGKPDGVDSKKPHDAARPLDR